MVITAQNLIDIAKVRNKDIPADKLTNAQDALATIDQELIQTEEEDKLIHEVWDKTSPINGVPAEVMLKRQDVDKTAEIYLIKDKATGRVIYFQPHEPNVGGLKRMTATDVLTIADNHRINVATERANTRIVEQAFKNLGI
jgi:hypothetical protein